MKSLKGFIILIYYLMAQQYAVTIKNIQMDVSPTRADTYSIYLDMLRTHKGIEHESHFELDSKGKVHLHGIFSARKNLKVDLYKRKFWHIYITKLETADDIQRWLTYIRKDVDKTNVISLDS